MKKLFFVFAFTLTLCSVASAQSVEIFMDKTEADGSRFIASESVNCRNGMGDKHPMSLAVSRFSFEDRISWMINLNFTEIQPYQIPKGGKLLLKLSDGSVIELTQILPAEQTTDLVGKYNDIAGIRTYKMRGTYSITEDQLKQIAEDEVVKIRVQREFDSFDTTYKKNKVGSAIAAAYAAVAEAAKTSNSNDIRSGF